LIIFCPGGDDQELLGTNRRGKKEGRGKGGVDHEVNRDAGDQGTWVVPNPGRIEQNWESSREKDLERNNRTCEGRLREVSTEGERKTLYVWKAGNSGQKGKGAGK